MSAAEAAGGEDAAAAAEALLAEVEPATRRRRHDPFEAWANFRALCEGHPQLGVCLQVGASLPPR